MQVDNDELKPIEKEQIENNVDQLPIDEQLVDEEQPPIRQQRNVEEDVIKLKEDRWPEVNGVYDSDGEWHDWNELTYSYSYDNTELIILPYTVCFINLRGEQYVAESSSS